MTILVFLAAAARTRIVPADLRFYAHGLRLWFLLRVLLLDRGLVSRFSKLFLLTLRRILRKALWLTRRAIGAIASREAGHHQEGDNILVAFDDHRLEEVERFQIVDH